MKVAVLLTTFNRRKKTLTCLESLEKQVLAAGTTLEVFLTDDNSADGTPEAVKALFPETHVLSGNGHLYWAGGMRHTWLRAMQHDPDAYLLLNDDTTLYPHAVQTLLDTAQRYPFSICAGSTCDNGTGQLSYGGWQLLSKRYWKSRRIFSETDAADCDFANANIMLVPRQIVWQIGILADRFTHSLADYDYCLKAKRYGIDVKLAPGFQGTCIDDHGKNWRSQHTTLKERIQYLKSPKGLAYKEYLWFIRQHFPLSYPSAFLKLWMKTFFPFIWDHLKK